MQKEFTEKLRQDDGAAVNRKGLFDLLGIEYVIGRDTQPNLKAAGFLSAVQTEDEFTLYRVNTPGPRVRTYSARRSSQTRTRRRSGCWATASTPAPSGSRAAGRHPGGPCGSAELAGERVNSLKVGVDLPEDGWLFVADSWYPGWRAEVDGEVQEVERAQSFFRAVRVPAGRHEVKFVYFPLRVRVGLAVSGLTLAAVLLSLARSWRKLMSSENAQAGP